MKPVFFSEANCTMTGSGDVRDLPVYRDEIGVLSKWEMTPQERIIASVTGVVWVRTMGQTVPPLMVFGTRPFADAEAEDEVLDAHEWLIKRRAAAEPPPPSARPAPDLRHIIDRVGLQSSPWWIVAAGVVALALVAAIAAESRTALWLLGLLMLVGGRAVSVALRIALLDALEEAEEALDEA